MTSNNIKNAPGFSKPQGFAKVKSDRPPTSQTEPAPADSNCVVGAYKIDAMREGAIALSATSHEAMSALQSAGLQSAAAYVQRKQAERNLVVEKVSDAIAYLSDPDLLEADIMSATAAKMKQRTNAWGYESSSVNLDELFALPAPSQRLIGEG